MRSATVLERALDLSSGPAAAAALAPSRTDPGLFLHTAHDFRLLRRWEPGGGERLCSVMDRTAPYHIASHCHVIPLRSQITRFRKAAFRLVCANGRS